MPGKGMVPAAEQLLGGHRPRQRGLGAREGEMDEGGGVPDRGHRRAEASRECGCLRT